MGLFSIFKRKKKKELPPLEELPKIPEVSPTPEKKLEESSVENLKVKMDLILTHLDSLKTQYEALNERIKNIEKMVEEIRSYYYK